MLLPLLIVPRLEQLEFSGMVGRLDASTDAFQALLSCSSCGLGHLSIDLVGDVARIQRFLRTANSIVHLTLPVPGNKNQIPVLKGIAVLPWLKHLEIHDVARGDDHRQLLDMLWWRRTHAGLELCEVFLGPWVPFGIDVLPAIVVAEFCALAETGL
ncbi:hypothetical protein B0H19DRAFT_1250386 [Mycena capillaripes]|nr:hypothetical protein B0H19DRAFT_1250386 [Mycena capillaripes]